MKKKLTLIVSLVLALTFCFGCFVACQSGLTAEQLDALYKEFTKLHKNDVEESPSSYWVEGSIYVLENGGNEISANVKWAIEGTTLVTVGETPNNLGQIQIIVPDEVSETVNYKLVGTLVDEKNNAYKNADGNPYKLEISKTILVGKTYKLAIRQLTNGTVIYAKAAVAATYYIDSVAQSVGGADFHTEKVDGGYKIYTMVGTSKCYLGAKISGGHNNIILGGVLGETNASTYEGSVWTISENEIKTVVGDKTLYLGTYGDKTTFSVSEYKTYPAFLVEIGTEVKPQAIVADSENNKNATVTFTSPATVEDSVVVDLGTVVTFTVVPEEGYEIVSVKNGTNKLEATSGNTYSITVNAGATIIVETKVIGSNGAASPVVGAIVDKTMPAGWEYISNNPEQYPDPSYYGTSGKQGLKINFLGMGIASPDLDNATGDITVKVNIYALNNSQDVSGTNEHVFKVEGLDASGNVVVTGYIDTCEIGENNQVVLNAGTTVVTKIRVTLVEKPITGTKNNNVNLGGVTISWGTTEETPAE